MKIFETHAHYDDRAFDEDRDSLIRSLPGAGIRKAVNIGARMEGAVRSAELSDEYDFFYAAVGIHPSECGDMTEADIEKLRGLAREHKKVVAIGEIGLDYHYPEPERDWQKKWFVRQIELAKELGLPVVIHSRDAAEDTADILRRTGAGEVSGVIHCYSYSPEMARTFLDMGFYIGVGGVVTFKNAKKLVRTVEETPMERIVIETDSPYLAPVPHRGERNSSLNLPLVIDKIAEIKGMSPDEVADITYENAMKMYRITEPD